ncbi:MAG: DUF4271 domain-containing protein [Flavobacteriaceae bacterium]|nr:DUF4271 domain-containing protein [Flavobacteriaceae bacterium]
MEYTLRNIENNDWISLVIIGLFILLAITRYLYPQRFEEFILLPITDRYFTLQGKGYELNHPFNVLFLVIQVVSFSLFFYFASQLFTNRTTHENPWFFLQLITGISVFILAKYLIEKIIGNLFNMEKLIDRFLYEKLCYASLLALFILIGNTLFFYIFKAQIGLYKGFAVVICVLFLITLLSSYKRNWTTILRHFFYFILYLCALEIAPYIILYKILV